MNTLAKDMSLSQITKVPGVGYLIIFITGIYVNFFVIESLIVPGNASVKVNNISSNEFLFRIGIVSFMIMVIFDVVLNWALYVIFEPIEKTYLCFQRFFDWSTVPSFASQCSIY